MIFYNHKSDHIMLQIKMLRWISLHSLCFKTALRNFPGYPVVKTLLPIQGAQVQFLAGELRSHMPHSAAKIKKKKQKTPFKSALTFPVRLHLPHSSNMPGSWPVPGLHILLVSWSRVLLHRSPCSCFPLNSQVLGQMSTSKKFPLLAVTNAHDLCFIWHL